MKNSSFRNGRSQTFIDSFYYMDLIYFNFKTYQMECYVRILFYGSISFENKAAVSNSHCLGSFINLAHVRKKPSKRVEASTLLSIDRSTTPLFDFVNHNKNIEANQGFDFIKYSPTVKIFE